MRAGGWIGAGAALAAGLAVLVIFFVLTGHDPAMALAAMWRGAFGSWFALTSGTLIRAVPIALIALGFTVAYRAGALNIGGEGQFYAGAIAATWAGLRLGSWSGALAIPVTLTAAFAAGAVWITLPAVLRRRFGVQEVISTLLLNFVAEALTSLLVQGPLQESQHIYPQSDPIAESARLPLLPGTRLHAGLALALAGAVLLHWVFSRTLWGFRLRAVGLGPRAAEIAGRIDSRWITALALALSGAIAGLAGGVEVSGVSYALFQNLSPGYGFTAIAVALLGRLHPFGVVLAGLLFGALEAGAGAMQREADVPAVAVYLVEAVVIIVVLLAESARRHGATTLASPASVVRRAPG